MKQFTTTLYKSSLLLILTGVLMYCQSEPEVKQDTVVDEDQFTMHVRTAPAQTAGQQLKSFKLPAGFKIELFASEPDIGKPMNISFDARGRLWVTQSKEYPFYDSTEYNADRITILEDTNHDGKADKIITFADSLNIPIGIVPVQDGAIAFSIPYVYHLIDSDGDDQVDQRKVLLSGFQYKDTHGMINNFFRGLDGWIHADHGFSNLSEVVGTDQQPPLTMSSGNTFRFRPDGSGVEFTTTGRVNPFGYAMDEYGYLYSVDCHSSPLYQLIRGADYPHFGKQPTGIGFGPAMMPHNYGSTALAGLEYYSGNQFPVEYQSNFYLGDVVKSRVYRASVSMAGTTPVPNWEPDFIVSEDPWFRPVDVKLGPDGALYIADFYNRIIGHYEVPLDHPGRDRERGRIWRITFDDNRQQHQSPDWEQAALEELIDGLTDPSLTVRMLVADQIVDRFGESASAPVLSLLENPDTGTEQYIHGLWILHRLGKLDPEHIERGLSHSSELIQLHTLRILFEINATLTEDQLNQVSSMAGHQSPHIRRAVVMILGQHPASKHVELLLSLPQGISENDTHFAYAVKQSVRNNLRDPGVLSLVLNQNWELNETVLLSQAMMGVDNSDAAKFMAANLDQFSVEDESITNMVSHIVRYLPAADLNSFVQQLRPMAADSLDRQMRLLEAVQHGYDQRGQLLSGYGQQWTTELAKTFLAEEANHSVLSKESREQLVARQIFACQVARVFKINTFSEKLKQLMASRDTDVRVRDQAAQALMAITPDNYQDVAVVAADTSQVEAVRQRLLLFLIQENSSGALNLAGNLLNGFSFDAQKRLVSALSNHTTAIDVVLNAAESLNISPKILLDPSINDLLHSNMTAQQQKRFNAVTENLTPFSNEIAYVIRSRVEQYPKTEKSFELGSKIFETNCAICHQIGGNGETIGPQLDGIGNWGLQALTEKVLDPNRNISQAFVNYSITLKDGSVKQGLFRRDEGSSRVFADLAGQEFSIPAAQIVKQSALPFTLMPDNFYTTISESDYYHLMEYLLDQN